MRRLAEYVHRLLFRGYQPLGIGFWLTLFVLVGLAAGLGFKSLKRLEIAARDALHEGVSLTFTSPDGQPRQGVIANIYDSADFATPSSAELLSKDFLFQSNADFAHHATRQLFIRLTGMIRIPATGQWQFFIDASEGARLRIGGLPVYDAWNSEVRGAASEVHEFEEGWKSFDLQWHDAGNDGWIGLAWEGPGTARQVIPMGAFSPRFPETASAAASTSQNSLALATSEGQPYSGILGTFYRSDDFTNPIRMELFSKSFTFGQTTEFAHLNEPKLSARFTAMLRVPAAGKWRFFVDASEGARVRLNGKSIYDDWKKDVIRLPTEWHELEAGWVELDVEWHDSGSDGWIGLLWEGPDRNMDYIPAEFMKPRFPTQESPAP